jgi:8-amino-7-oxononanoate synthase
MTTLAEALARQLEGPRWTGGSLYASEVRPGHATVAGRDCIVLCSNDYLGLAGDARVVEAASLAGRRFGFGARAARSFLGDTTAHRDLEAALAELKGAEAAMLFSSGYACNLAVMGTLASAGDLICSDELNHASIIDGSRLSRAEIAVHRHCDVEHLGEVLERRPPGGRALVVTESVFSMDGDVTPLREIIEVARGQGAAVILDEAHATGVLGPNGEGLLAELQLGHEVDVVCGTLGKALGSVGGFVAGSRDLVDFLAQKGRTFLFDTALPAPAAAAAHAALRIIGAEPEHVTTLRRNVRLLNDGLLAAGYRVVRSESAILPVDFDDPAIARHVCDLLFDRAVVARPIAPPYVPPGTSRIRVQASAAHSVADIERILIAFEEARAVDGVR